MTSSQRTALLSFLSDLGLAATVDEVTDSQNRTVVRIDDLVIVQRGELGEPGEPIPQEWEDVPTAPIPAETLDEVSARHRAGRGDPPIHVTEKPTRNLRRPTRIPGCTCTSGLSGSSCTLDCRAPAWSR